MNGEIKNFVGCMREVKSFHIFTNYPSAHIFINFEGGGCVCVCVCVGGCLVIVKKNYL